MTRAAARGAAQHLLHEPVAVCDIATDVFVVGGSTPCEAAYRILTLAEVDAGIVRCADGSLGLVTVNAILRHMGSASAGSRYARTPVERVADRYVPVLPPTMPAHEAALVVCTSATRDDHTYALVSGPTSIGLVSLGSLLRATRRAGSGHEIGDGAASEPSHGERAKESSHPPG